MGNTVKTNTTYFFVTTADLKKKVLTWYNTLVVVNKNMLELVIFCWT